MQIVFQRPFSNIQGFEKYTKSRSLSTIHLQEINEVNVFTAWRQLLEENEKISKARLAAVQVFTDR